MRLLRKADDLPTRSLWQRIRDVALTDVGTFVRGGQIAGSLERLEEMLLEADFGVPTTLRLVSDVEHQAQRGYVKTHDQFREALRQGIEDALRVGSSDPKLARASDGPTVILVV